MAQLKIVSRWNSSAVLYEGEANTLKDLIGTAVKSGADLRGADLRGADLRGAYLRGADLQGADLQGAYLQGAYLRGADLRGADLQGAYLQGAYLRGAYLQGAYLQGADLQGFKVKQANVLTGLYEYVVIPFVTEENERRIVMGCRNRSLLEWESNEWNNLSEFPDDGSEKSRARHFALGVAKQWLSEFTAEGAATTPDGSRTDERE